MGTVPNKAAAARQSQQQGFVYLPLIAGWLVPGAGHFLLRKWGRGALLAVSIIAMFALGLAMDGKLYTGAQDILDMLGLVGDLGNGLLFFVSRVAGPGRRSGAVHHRRLRHQVHRRCRPAQRHRRRGRPQSAHREESPSAPAPPTLRRCCCSRFSRPRSSASPSARRRAACCATALYCFVLFVGSAIVLSWVMFLIAR